MFYEVRICLTNIAELREMILNKAHNIPYKDYPGSTKLYQDMKETFWWEGLKRNVAEYVQKCIVCQQVKEEHKRPFGLKSLHIPG